MANVVELRKSLKQTIEEAGEELLQKIQSLVNQETEPIEITDPETIVSIERGIADIEAGRVYSIEEIRSEIKTWGNRKL